MAVAIMRLKGKGGSFDNLMLKHCKSSEHGQRRPCGVTWKGKIEHIFVQ